MRIKRSLLAVFALLASAGTALAQAATNAVPAAPGALPQSKSELWTLAIAGVTPLITAGIYKLVPRVPKLLLPVATPFIGVGLGMAINALGTSNLGWVDMAQAGALAVFIRETFNQASKTALIQGLKPSPPAAPPATPPPPASTPTP